MTLKRQVFRDAFPWLYILHHHKYPSLWLACRMSEEKVYSYLFHSDQLSVCHTFPHLMRAECNNNKVQCMQMTFEWSMNAWALVQQHMKAFFKVDNNCIWKWLAEGIIIQNYTENWHFYPKGVTEQNDMIRHNVDCGSCLFCIVLCSVCLFVCLFSLQVIWSTVGFNVSPAFKQHSQPNEQIILKKDENRPKCVSGHVYKYLLSIKHKLWHN